MMLRGSVVTPAGIVTDGVVEVTDDKITEVRAATPADDEAGVRTGAWIVPGFVDIHVHGGGGFTFTTGDADQARGAAEFHLGHGTTTMVASLVTAPHALLREATVAFAPLVADGVLAGVHVEGPYLSAARCGAQNPTHLRNPDPGELSELLSLGGVRMMTIAPELPGALDAIGQLVGAGVVAAVGHTDATYEQTRAAIDEGARLATHLCNAMRPVHHREPGPIVALLDAPEVVCEQIADGVHLHEGMLRHVAHAAGPDRVALVTDAMAAAGMDDGEFDLGGLVVRVRRGVARLSGDGTIAGSTLTMDAAVRTMVHSGLPIEDAARMAATTPARVLGLDGELGAVAVGLRADLVLLDEELRVTGVLRNGIKVV